eukprot:scaffold69098_cov54-Phaeocystis_antarctica.AAC.3
MRFASWARDSHRIRARVGRVAVDHELVAADAQLSGENGSSVTGSAVIATEEFARKVLRPHPQVRVEAGTARIERMRAPNRGAELVDVVGSRIANSVRRAAGPRTPARAVASRGKGRGARPRATDAQLVGVGQGVCVLPSRREGIRCGRRCDPGGGRRRATAAHAACRGGLDCRLGAGRGEERTENM